MSANSKLPLSFYRQPDVVALAQQLIGKVLCTRINGFPLTSGLITETEAYCGRGDKASHAHDGRRTARTETMYQAGGVGYVYLCYGIHHLFNVVTNIEGRADAILVRAVQPLDGIETILQRRDAQSLTPAVSAGPGRLTEALGIRTNHTGINLTGDTIWIEDRGRSFRDSEIAASKRVGVDYAGEHAKRLWRFYLQSNTWVSK